MQILGLAYIYVDGELLPTEEGAKIDLGGISRESKVGSTFLGTVEKFNAAKLECKIAIRKDEDIAERARKMTDVSITFEGDNGVRYIMTEASLMNTPELNAGGDGTTLTFEGNAAEKTA